MLVRFRPRKDITIWELAQSLQLYLDTNGTKPEDFKAAYMGLSPEARRHLWLDKKGMEYIIQPGKKETRAMIDPIVIEGVRHYLKQEGKEVYLEPIPPEDEG
jgi:hypothetical protein